MEIDLGPQAAKFRDELRDWLVENKPDDLDDNVDARAADVPRRSRGQRVDARSCTDAGYMCVAWPKEFGGRGLSGIEVAVLNEEFARAACRA